MDDQRMGALRVWKEQVQRCRDERVAPDPGEYANWSDWYDRWVHNNDYARLLLPRLLAAIGPASRVLEIGPGPGVFTIPLAARAGEVVVFEPAEAMREGLAENLRKADLANVRVVPETVEHGLRQVEGSFDMALASHSLYDVSPMDEVLTGLLEVAKMTFILFWTGEQPPWYNDLEHRFRGKTTPEAPGFNLLYPVMLEMGILGDVEILWTSSNYVFGCEDEALGWWMHHFRVHESRRNELAISLRSIMEPCEKGVIFRGRHRDALISIDRERHDFRPECVTQSVHRPAAT